MDSHIKLGDFSSPTPTPTGDINHCSFHLVPDILKVKLKKFISMCLGQKKKKRRGFTQSISENIATLGLNISFSLSPKAITLGTLYAFGVIKIELWSNYCIIFILKLLCAGHNDPISQPIIWLVKWSKKIISAGLRGVGIQLPEELRLPESLF